MWDQEGEGLKHPFPNLRAMGKFGITPPMTVQAKSLTVGFLWHCYPRELESTLLELTCDMCFGLNPSSLVKTSLDVEVDPEGTPPALTFLLFPWSHVPSVSFTHLDCLSSILPIS